ncbi:HyaD/HybD family hydrogenase maturation endopeptidase [Sporomusa termitida]|uniref:Hydrogenase 2 maturation protease n=1 Tax=Sporomusa termitida TaxID=2377 RepID=A0A517DZ13_9FIRM|nr:HyaD/HybD family hydrogenase maturation endopeptidase [Sporomusa termitida]QDR82591.1 Hydrogenase 2 maturation protease [Sporomusa termitida]
MERITVLGIGNILLQDEGFGVRVIEQLQQRYCFPANVQVLDGGTLGLELIRFITGTNKLMVIDAIDGGGAPGFFYRFAGSEAELYLQHQVSMHELGLKDVLATLTLLEKPVGEVIIMGVEPASLELGLALSAPVSAMVDRALLEIIAQLAVWQVEAGLNGTIKTGVY